MAPMKKMTLRVGDENRIVVENLLGKGIDNSIFSDQYHKALHVIDSFLSHRANYDREQNDFPSNVFAFVGERGSGKTSCMSSIAGYLKSNSVSDSYPNLKANLFISLRLIDPTFFSDEKESIVGHVLSQLLQLFKDIRNEKKKQNEDTEVTLEKDLVEKFQEVSSNIECLKHEREMTPDDLEYLNQLSSAVDLKNNIRELIKKLLQYKGTPNAIIVIPIDDIDMNKDGVTKMVEDIRKYLSNEYLLIMVAVHLNQLTLIEKQEYYSQYKTLLENNQIHPVRIDKMTEKFLDKFLPQAHRIIMPDGAYYLGSPMEIKDGDKTDTYASVRQGICEMIFVKTRYLFYNSNDTASRIIPRNLRDLRHLIGLLYNMANYDKKKAHDQAIDASGIYNKALFKEYLFGRWCRENLEEEMRQDVLALLTITDVTLFNSRVIEILRRFFNDLAPLRTGNNSISSEVLNGIMAEGNNNFNFSVGDALNIIFLLEGMTSDELKCNLLFLLKTIYSIKLYEFYDERTGARDDIENEKELLLDDRIAKYNLSNYEKFVAGGFVNPAFYALLPNEKGMLSRQYRAVNLLRVNQLISECVNHWDVTPPETINLTEYFMLCISRPYDSKNRGSNIGYVELDYRRRTEPYYAQDLSASMVSACFDANALLFNLTRIQQCYERFPRGDEFFKLADAERDAKNAKSLWAKLKVETLTRNGLELNLNDFKFDRWLSWASIRNAEILQQLLNVLSFTKNDARHVAGNKNVLANYYKRMSNYSIKNYDKKRDGEEFFRIDYKYTAIISEALTRGDQGLFDEVFLSLPDAAILFDGLFDRRRKEPYNKEHVIRKLAKFGRDKGLNIPQDLITDAMNAVEGDTIPVAKVVELVDDLNARLNENGGAQENA